MGPEINKVKALSDPGRMRTVAALMHCRELCVCQIRELLGLATATVSRHISLLQNAGLVKSRKSGRWVYYSLSGEIDKELKIWLEKKVFHTIEAAEDRKELKKILSRDPAELCGSKE